MTALIDDWRPPAANLIWRDGLWVSRHASPISYPSTANDAFLGVEDESYWFRHRLDCIAELLQRFPPEGDFYDIGGGNGFVAAGLEGRGWTTVLVEPGSGARNALRRGLPRVVQATLQDAAITPGALAAAGAFDVVEHIEDDGEFLRELHRCLRPGGRFYCTVPAWPALWSREDESAGHFRRYTPHGLARVLRRAGYEIEFLSPIFSWLVIPVFLLRSLPSRFQKSSAEPHRWNERTTADHRLPAPLRPIVARFHAGEIDALRRLQPLPRGTSLICVARRPFR